MSYKFNCPHCNQKLEADDSLQTENVGCPSCEKIITIVPEDHNTPPVKKKYFKSKKILIPIISLAVIIATTLVIMLSIQEDPETQYQRGIDCVRGEKGANDYKKAFKWFLKAAKQGHLKSQYVVGVCYDAGEGVGKDVPKSAIWFKKAAVRGHAEAQYKLGLYYKMDGDSYQAMKWAEKAAQQGHLDAQYFVGLGYCIGKGIAKNGTTGIWYLRKAARQGHVKSIRTLRELRISY